MLSRWITSSIRIRHSLSGWRRGSRRKRRIARAASRLIGNGETLLINGGSTTKFFAAELAEKRNLTVVTNNLGIPATLPPDCFSNVYILGGEYKGDAQVTVGPVGFVSAASISVDSAVIGVGGVTVKEGLTTTVLEECSMILAMINAARRTIVLADCFEIRPQLFRAYRSARKNSNTGDG